MDFLFKSKSSEDKLIETLNNPQASQSQIDRALKNISSLDTYTKATDIFKAMKSRRDREASLPPPKSSWFIWSPPGRLENANLKHVLTIAQKCLETKDKTLLSKSSDQSIESSSRGSTGSENQTEFVDTDNSPDWQIYRESSEERIKKIADIITESSSNKPIQKRSWSWLCFSQKPTAANQEEKPVSTTKISSDDLERLNTEDQQIFEVVGYNRLRKLFDRIPKQEIPPLCLDSEELEILEHGDENEDFLETETVNSNDFLKKIEELTVPKLDIPGNQEIDQLIQIIKRNNINSKEFARALKKIEALPYILPEKKAEIVLVLNSKTTNKPEESTTEVTSELVNQQYRSYPFKKRINSFFEVNIEKRIKDLKEKLLKEETEIFLEEQTSPILPSEGESTLTINSNVKMERSSLYNKDYKWALVVDIEVADNKTEKICLGYFKNPVEGQLQTLVSDLCKKIPGEVVSAKVSHLDKAPRDEYRVVDVDKLGKDRIKEAQLNKIAMSNKFPKDFTTFKEVSDLPAYSIPQEDGSFKAINVAKQMEGLFRKGDRIAKISIDNSIAECPGTFADDFIMGRAPIEFCGHNFEKSRSKDTGQQLTDAFSLVALEYKAMCEAAIEEKIDPIALFVIIHQGALKPLADYADYLMVKLKEEQKDLIQYKVIPPSVKAFFEDGNFVIEYESKLLHQTKNNQRKWIPLAEVSWKRRVIIPISELQKINVTKKDERYVLENIPENIQATDSWGDYTVL